MVTTEINLTRCLYLSHFWQFASLAIVVFKTYLNMIMVAMTPLQNYIKDQICLQTRFKLPIFFHFHISLSRNYMFYQILWIQNSFVRKLGLQVYTLSHVCHVNDCVRILAASGHLNIISHIRTIMPVICLSQTCLNN